MTVRGSTLGLVRFVCHIPLFIYMIWGMHNYLFVKKHAGILLAPPLGRWVLLVESFAGPGVSHISSVVLITVLSWLCRQSSNLSGIFSPLFLPGLVKASFSS